MAIRTLIEDGHGAIGTLPDIVLKEGKMTEQMALTLSGKLQEMIRQFNGRISIGSGLSGHRAGNLDAQYIDVVVPSVANTEFIVPHGLGRKPVGYILTRQDRAVVVYDSSAGSWSDSLIYLKANVADATVTLMVW